MPVDKPERADVPAAPKAAEVVKDVKGGAAVVVGEAFEPSIDNIARRTTVGTLSGGLRTAVLPKKTP